MSDAEFVVPPASSAVGAATGASTSTAERVQGTLSSEAACAPNERPRFTGRLLKGVAVADELGADVTVDELRAVNLRGAPLRFEHSEFTGQVGEIVDSYVDSDGWLWISGELYSESERPHAELPGWLRQKLRSGELSSLSISHEYERDPTTRKRVGPRVFREASLVKRGKYLGTHVVSVQASEKSSSAHTQTERIIVQLSHVQPRATLPTAPKTTAPMASAQDGASSTPAAMTSGLTRQQIADKAAQAGVAFTAQELQGRSEMDLFMLMADKMQQRQASTDAMIAEATEIKKRDTERKRAEMAPKLELMKKLGEQAGFKDPKALKMLDELYGMDETEPIAHFMSAIADLAQRSDAGLANGRAELAKMQAEREALDAQLTDFKAREHLQQRKRSADGTYAQQLPTRMATGGAPATASTTSTSADTETVETEASEGGAQKRHQDGLSAFRQRVRGDQSRFFSHIPSDMLKTLNESSSRTVLTQASAYIGSASGGISSFERKLMARFKKLESDNGNDEMM